MIIMCTVGKKVCIASRINPLPGSWKIWKDIMIHNVYPTFEIFTELNLVCVTFKVADTLEIKDLVVKEYEKYASYLINQFGIKCVSRYF